MAGTRSCMRCSIYLTAARSTAGAWLQLMDSLLLLLEVPRQIVTGTYSNAVESMSPHVYLYSAKQEAAEN